MSGAPYRVRLMSNRQGGFYELVGPVLSRREIVKELGHPVWDDDGKTWSVAVSQSKLIACVGICGEKVSSLYVVPDRRREGIATRVLERALATGPVGSSFSATVTPSAVVVFEKNGFAKTGERGCYALMVRP